MRRTTSSLALRSRRLTECRLTQRFEYGPCSTIGLFFFDLMSSSVSQVRTGVREQNDLAQGYEAKGEETEANHLILRMPLRPFRSVSRSIILTRISVKISIASSSSSLFKAMATTRSSPSVSGSSGSGVPPTIKTSS